MTAIDSLAISVPVLISIFGLVIAWQNFKLNRKKDTKNDTQERVEDETRLIAIEKDVQYIRLSIDKVVETQKDHETRIRELEKGGTK